MIQVIDATLREGAQTASGPLSVNQAVEVAGLLEACGADMIECGHPFIGGEEMARVQAVVRAVSRVPVLAHARAHRSDIDAVAESGASWVGIFLGVNGISSTARLPNRSQGDLFELITDSVKYAAGRGLKVRFTVEDGGRTNQDDLLRAFEIALAAGADRLCFPDTVGALEPGDVAERIWALREAFADAELEVHLHDDRGLALANSLAAVDAGANWVSTSVNGMGERAGVTDFAQLVVNLHLRGLRELPPSGLLQELSRRVGAYTRSMPDHRRPVVGRDAFHHVARLHVAAVERAPSSYEFIDPASLGRERVMAAPRLSKDPASWVVKPPVISATELRYHRAGPGDRYVMVDDRFVPGAGQYCIARRIAPMSDAGEGHVDSHTHACDSLFMFLGDEEGYQGMTVEVQLDDDIMTLQSPVAVFIPAGVEHRYRFVAGSGTYINHVLAGEYNGSLLESDAG